MKAENVELLKEGHCKCGICFKVKPVVDFPQHVPTGKVSRYMYECCEQCLDSQKKRKYVSGVTQKMRDRNATRCLGWQRKIKYSLKGKDGYDKYNEECDAANPEKK